MPRPCRALAMAISTCSQGWRVACQRRTSWPGATFTATRRRSVEVASPRFGSAHRPSMAPRSWPGRSRNNGLVRTSSRGDAKQPYRVFMRFNPVNPGGGVEIPNSFVATFDGSTKADALQLTLAHEMLHTWGPRLKPEGFPTQWFTEGTAVFYRNGFCPYEPVAEYSGAFPGGSERDRGPLLHQQSDRCAE